MALADVIDLLACPVCEDGFTFTEDLRSVVCPRRHTYDVARQGYLNLFGGQQPRNADTSAMVTDRDTFLAAGHYRPLAERLGLLALETDRDAVVLDAGGGTGYYLAAVLSAAELSAAELRAGSAARGLSVDVSVPACRRAAQAHPRVGAVVADVWKRLPVLDETVDVVLSVFAPRNAVEFARVLRGDGRLVVVHPAPDHLAELHAPLDLLSIETGKADRLDAGLGSLFACAERQALTYVATMDRPTVREVVGMGPNAFHLSGEQLEAGLAGLDAPLDVTVSLSVSVWTPR